MKEELTQNKRTYQVEQTRLAPTWRTGCSTDKYCALCQHFRPNAPIKSAHTPGRCLHYDAETEAGENYCDAFKRNAAARWLFSPYTPTRANIRAASKTVL